jgi:hypothetical protein
MDSQIWKTIGEEAISSRDHGTPGTRRFKVVRASDNIEWVDEKTARYRSGVEMLLL